MDSTNHKKSLEERVCELEAQVAELRKMALQNIQSVSDTSREGADGTTVSESKANSRRLCVYSIHYGSCGRNRCRANQKGRAHY